MRGKMKFVTRNSGLILLVIFCLHEAAAQTGQNAAQIQQSAAQIRVPLEPIAAMMSLGQIRQVGAQLPIRRFGQTSSLFPIGQIRQTASQFPLRRFRQTRAQVPIGLSRQTGAQLPLPVGRIRQTGAQLTIPQTRQIDAQFQIPQSRQTDAQFQLPQIRQTDAQFRLPRIRQTEAQFSLPQIRQTDAQFRLPRIRQTDAQFQLPRIRQTHAQFRLPRIRQTDAQFSLPRIRQTDAQISLPRIRQTDAQFRLPRIRQTDAQFRLPRIRQTDAQFAQIGPNDAQYPIPDCQLKSIDLSSESPSVSAEAKSVGLSIASKLDSFMKNASISDPGAAPAYNQNLDFQFILDSSYSIGACDFLAAKDASKVVARYINERNPISPTGSRVGLIQFSHPRLTRVKFRFGDHESLSAVTSAIDRITYDRGTTATAVALKLAKTEFEQYGKVGHAKVAWVLTDGRSNTGGDPIPEADQLKNMGVTVCAVAIGRRIKMTEINGIATDGCVFQVPSYSTYREANVYAFAKSFGAQSSGKHKRKAKTSGKHKGKA